MCWQWLLETEKRLEFNGSLSVQRRAVVWKVIPWRMEIDNCGINTSWCPGRELEVTQGALTSSFGFDLLLRPGQTSCFSVYLFELTQFPFPVKWYKAFE